MLTKQLPIIIVIEIAIALTSLVMAKDLQHALEMAFILTAIISVAAASLFLFRRS